jgi:hypothetical protein
VTVTSGLASLTVIDGQTYPFSLVATATITSIGTSQPTIVEVITETSHIASATAIPTRSQSKGEPSSGAKAGIAIGVVILVLGLIIAAFFYFRRRKQRQDGGGSGYHDPKPNTHEMLTNSNRHELITNANVHEMEQKHQGVLRVREDALAEQETAGGPGVQDYAGHVKAASRSPEAEPYELHPDSRILQPLEDLHPSVFELQNSAQEANSSPPLAAESSSPAQDRQERVPTAVEEEKLRILQERMERIREEKERLEKIQELKELEEKTKGEILEASKRGGGG